MIEIHSARPEDDPQIAEVNRRAFGQEDEARLVAAICASPNHIPALSLVALEDGQIVGHLLLSPIEIETPERAVPALALAPMAVLPERQNRGIGSMLVRAGLRKAKQLGHRIVIVVGHPNYYPRFGFEPADQYGLESPFPAPREAFMALELHPGALRKVRGMVRYPAAFTDAV